MATPFSRNEMANTTKRDFLSFMRNLVLKVILLCNCAKALYQHLNILYQQSSASFFISLLKIFFNYP